jgi:outer membrane immunogenic protein
VKNLLVALLVLMVWAVPKVHAETYLSGNLGYVWLEDSDIRGNQGDSGEFSFDKGLAITAAIGKTLSETLRAEVELGYRTNEANEARPRSGETHSVDSDIVTLSIMANCFYDFIPGSVISPFLGAGIGIANVDGEVPNNNGKDDVFAYQFTVGAAYSVTEKLKLDVQYRLFGTDNPEFKNVEAEYLTHNVLFGLRGSI